jgi:hypothetical protein
MSLRKIALLCNTIALVLLVFGAVIEVSRGDDLNIILVSLPAALFLALNIFALSKPKSK